MAGVWATRRQRTETTCRATTDMGFNLPILFRQRGWGAIDSLEAGNSTRSVVLQLEEMKGLYSPALAKLKRQKIENIPERNKLEMGSCVVSLDIATINFEPVFPFEDSRDPFSPRISLFLQFYSHLAGQSSWDFWHTHIGRLLWNGGWTEFAVGRPRRWKMRRSCKTTHICCASDGSPSVLRLEDSVNLLCLRGIRGLSKVRQPAGGSSCGV